MATLLQSVVFIVSVGVRLRIHAVLVRNFALIWEVFPFADPDWTIK
jgi:hypothetical protein